MISNENKIHLISQQIKGGVTPYSITTSPGIRYDLNDSDEHKQLKFNRYIIDDIMKSQKDKWFHKNEYFYMIFIDQAFRDICKFLSPFDFYGFLACSERNG
eukprot:885825_1